VGAFSQNLGRRLRRHQNAERLVGVGIQRAGEVVGGGMWRSHYELRAGLGDANPAERQPDDVEGFITSTGRFLTRRAAIPVAIDAGQLNESWRDTRRDLLSSDVGW